jgi:hypothetical protein
MSEAEAVEFLVALARIDLERLKSGPPGDLPNLLYGLRRYLDVEAGGRMDSELRKTAKKAELLGPVIQRAREIVESVAERRRGTFRFGEGKIVLDATKARPVCFFAQSLADGLLLSAVDDLDSEQASRISKCEECRKIFYAGRKGQRYCTQACANVVAGKKYRESHGIERARRERERYRARKFARSRGTSE